MRSYGQYCSLAKALDIVGDRWTLLIVRELLIRPCRYGELQDSLPGIASNLLVARLRHLEEAGVVVKADAGQYVLTAWGEHLAEPVLALVRWGAPLMDVQEEEDSFQSQWLAHPIKMIFAGIDPSRPRFVAEIRAGDEPVTMESDGGEVHFRAGSAAAPDLVLTGPPDAIIGLLAGRLDQRAAKEQGVSVLGDVDTLAQLRRSDWLSGPELCRQEMRAARK
jgi:DNA-binding HxlR family transcriptional regulator